MDDLFDALTCLFGEVGIFLIPSSILIAAVVVELTYHFIHGGWIS